MLLRLKDILHVIVLFFKWTGCKIEKGYYPGLSIEGVGNNKVIKGKESDREYVNRRLHILGRIDSLTGTVIGKSWLRQ